MLIDTRSTRSTRTAVYIAALVAAYLAGVALLKVIIASIAGLVSSRDLYEIGHQWSGFAADLFGFVAVFALGVFLVLWLLAPISSEVSLRLAIARGALALVGGAVAVFLVGIVLGLIGVATDSLISMRAPGLDSAGYVVLGGFQNLFSTALDLAPLVLLATVLVWLRLRALAARPV